VPPQKQNDPISPSLGLWERMFGPKKRTTDIHLPSDDELSKGDIGYWHPANVKETPFEKMIKKAGVEHGTLIPDDYPYFEQYMHSDKDVLPKQELRPVINGKIPHPEDTFRHVARMDYPGDRKPRYDTMGLGNHFESTDNPAYDSIYDRWDFDTETPITTSDVLKTPDTFPFMTKEYLAKKVLQHLGKPFSVYERTPKGTLDRPAGYDDPYIPDFTATKIKKPGYVYKPKGNTTEPDALDFEYKEMVKEHNEKLPMKKKKKPIGGSK